MQPQECVAHLMRLPQAGKAAGHPADGPDRQAGEPADRQKGED